MRDTNVAVVGLGRTADSGAGCASRIAIAIFPCRSLLAVCRLWMYMVHCGACSGGRASESPASPGIYKSYCALGCCARSNWKGAPRGYHIPMCTRRERFAPTSGAAASTASQKIGRIERASARLSHSQWRPWMWSGSADGCSDGDDDSSTEDWISAYLRDHLDTALAGEWESCRDSHGFLPLF